MFSFAPRPRFRPYTSLNTYLSALRELLLGGWNKGDSITELEETFTRHFGTDFALAAPQARVGIYLAVKSAIKTSGRKKIVMSPYTIFDVVNMVVAAGGEPVFADIEPEGCNISADTARDAIDEQTAAILVTHIHGVAADVHAFRSLCDERSILMIEDAAQALGTTVDGRQVGTFGDLGIFSFGLAKNINSFLGGLVVSRNRSLDLMMREEISTFPMMSRDRLLGQVLFGLINDIVLHPILFKTCSYWLFRIGYLHNIEMINKRVTVEDNPVLRRDLPEEYKVQSTPTQARLVLNQLPGLEEQVRIRIANGENYFRALRDIPDISLSPHRTDGSNSYMSFGILAPDRHALLRHLMYRRRDCAVQHLKNCADLDCFQLWHRDCPNARRTAERMLILPTYPKYGEEDVSKTIDAVRSYFC